MKIPFYQVDAFSSKIFGGNPAVVCPLESWPADEILQNIAAENNLSETESGGSDQGKYLIIKTERPKNDSDL